VRLSVFAILAARVLFRASVFKVRTSTDVQGRRFPFFMSISQLQSATPTAKDGGVSTYMVSLRIKCLILWFILDPPFT
jgi:hypothetical protein